MLLMFVCKNIVFTYDKALLKSCQVFYETLIFFPDFLEFVLTLFFKMRAFCACMFGLSGHQCHDVSARK